MRDARRACRKKRDAALGDANTKLSKLKDDFSYNLKLIEERDAELEGYDASFSHLKALVRDRDIEISALTISAAEPQQSEVEVPAEVLIHQDLGMCLKIFSVIFLVVINQETQHKDTKALI